MGKKWPKSFCLGPFSSFRPIFSHFWLSTCFCVLYQAACLATHEMLLSLIASCDCKVAGALRRTPAPWSCSTATGRRSSARSLTRGPSPDLDFLALLDLLAFLDVLGFCLSIEGRQTGGFQTGGFPDLDLSFLFCPFLSFLGLSRFFRDFPDLLGDGPGIFPIRPFSLSWPIKSTYEEQSRKGPRHNLDLSRKKWETPGFANPPVWLLSIQGILFFLDGFFPSFPGILGSWKRRRTSLLVVFLAFSRNSKERKMRALHQKQ